MVKTKVLHIYAELDTIIDTTTALLQILDPQAAMAAIADQKWHFRESNAYGPVTLDTFVGAWDRRDIGVLSKGIRTRVPGLINRIALCTKQKAIGVNEHVKVVLVVNTLPYDIPDATNDVLVAVLKESMSHVDDVTVRAVDMDELHPSRLRNHGSIMFMYDYSPWLEHYAANGVFDKVGCPEIVLLSPALYYRAIPPMHVVKETEALGLTVFDAARSRVLPYVNLFLLPPYVFTLPVEIKDKDGVDVANETIAAMADNISDLAITRTE